MAEYQRRRSTSPAHSGDTIPKSNYRRTTSRSLWAGPRRTPTAREATLHLQLTPGTDLALALGMLHIALADGLHDTAYIAQRTTGFPAARSINMLRYSSRSICTRLGETCSPF